MKNHMNPLMARFSSEPALIDPSAIGVVSSHLAAAMQAANIEDVLASTDDDEDTFWPDATHWSAAYRPYVVKNGLLHIPVKGVLLHDFPYALGNWATGYKYIQRAFERGCRDYQSGSIKGIALIIHSPGGMVAGCFDTLDKMVALRDEVGVPVRSFAHEGAYSAAYATALLGDRIDVSRTGGVGSIGVVTTHYDWSKFNDDFGVKVTYIFAGKHKVDGNPDEPLPDDVRARMQERIDELYQVFVSAVARNRGLEEDAVRATEALCFTATQAVSNGLADAIGSLDDAVAAFAVDLSSDEGDEEMSNQDNSAVEQAAENITAARTAGFAEGKAAGLAEGASTERARINGILACDAGKERPTAALAAALDTDMTVEQANAFLSKLPAEAARSDEGSESAETPFQRAMSQDNPNVGGNHAKTNNDGGEHLTLADRVFGARKSA